MERRTLVILGPTASGKSALGLELAEKLGTEVISADSRQVFKHMDIGTAKLMPYEQKGVRHHFVDCFLPDEQFNASLFELGALKIIENLHSKGKIPVVAGGSGLYLRALTKGISRQADTDPEYRGVLKNILDTEGKEALYDLLMKKDPKSALSMTALNYKRVIRALEVFHATGKSIGEIHQSYERNDDIVFLKYGLRMERKILYQRIESRVDSMISGGLLSEVSSLLESGYSPSLNALNTVGYKEIISHLKGEISLERAVELIKRNTRRYAKRQMTWFNAEEDIRWIDVSSPEDIHSACLAIINNLHE